MGKSRNFLLAAGFVLLTAVTWWDVSAAFRQAEHFEKQTYNLDVEQRVNYWILSAQCAKKTGVWLAVCGPQGQIEPLENFSLADDRGHALLLTAATQWFRLTPDRVLLTKINVLLNALGGFCLVAMLLFVRLPIAAACALGFVLTKSIPGPLPGPDVPSAYLGILCFSLIPIVWLLGIRHVSFSRPWLLLGSVLSWLCLAAALLLRQPLGLIGCGLCIVLVISKAAMTFKMMRQKALVSVGIIVCLVGIALAAPSIVLQVRKVFWGVPSGTSVVSHGMSQSFFHGLGTEPNPWGISWSDVYGLHLIQKLRPDVVYLSPEHFRVLRGLYWHILLTEPVAVVRIYAMKLWKVWNLPLHWMGMNLFWATAFLSLILLLGIWKGTHEMRYPLVMSCWFLAAWWLVILQGVIGIPWVKHIYPSKLLTVLMVGALLDAGMRKGVAVYFRKV